MYANQSFINYMKKHRVNYALERFKNFINEINSINEQIDANKLSYEAAKRIVDEKSRDAAGQQFCKCEEHYRNGHTHFEIPKKDVLKFMI